MSEMRHAMAEQDVAILDYLDGLLRDSDVAVGSSVSLTLVSSADEAVEETDFPGEEPQAEEVVEVPSAEGASEEPVTPDDAVTAVMTEEVEPSMAEEEAPLSVDSGPAEEPSAPEPMTAELPTESDAGDVAVDESAMVMPEAAASVENVEAQPEPSAPVEQNLAEATEMPEATTPAAIDSDYLILSVGSLQLAFPRSEIVATLQEPQIEPLRGAPEQVAGVVEFDGSRRMVLSLSDIVIGHAAVPQNRTVLMLGGGLWGVAGGPLSDEQVVDHDRIKWRSPTERHGARPWLAGLSRTDGVAIVDTAALRLALSGNQ